MFSLLLIIPVTKIVSFLKNTSQKLSLKHRKDFSQNDKNTEKISKATRLMVFHTGIQPDIFSGSRFLLQFYLQWTLHVQYRNVVTEAVLLDGTKCLLLDHAFVEFLVKPIWTEFKLPITRRTWNWDLLQFQTQPIMPQTAKATTDKSQRR